MRATADIMRDAGTAAARLLPKNMGWCLLVFEFERPGSTGNYISNANRADMIAMLRETADRLEKNQDFQTPSN